MSENSRINGFDTKAPTRVDTLSGRKAVRGRRATTFADDPEKKQKINLYFESDDRDFLEQVEEMFRNPAFAISKLKGMGVSEKQLLHSYRYSHSVGDIDYTTIENVEFGSYGIKTDLIDQDNEQWNYVIHETFSVANGFPSDTGVDYKTDSIGGLLQRGKTISWSERLAGQITDATYFLFDDQSLRVVGGPFIADTRKVHRYYDLEAYIYTDVGSRNGGIVFGYNGKSSSDCTFFWAGIDFNSGKFELLYYLDNSVVTTLVSQSISTSVNLWYKVRVIVDDKQITVFWNDEYLFTKYIDEMVIGDVGVRGSSGGVNFDGFKMKSRPYPIIGTPQNSKATQHVHSKQVLGAYGTQERIFTEEKLEYQHEGGMDCVINIDMSRRGAIIQDRSSNLNIAIVRDGSWVDGYITSGIELINGDVKISDHSSLQSLNTEMTIHFRFKITKLHTTGNGTGEILFGKGTDWRVFDYNDNGTHKIAFETNDVLNVGDEIEEDVWYEFFFLTDTKSSFIFRRDSTGTPQPEARALFYSGASDDTYEHTTDLTDDVCIGSLGTIVSETDFMFDKFAIYNKFIIPMRYLDSIWTTRIWSIPEDDIGNRHMKSLILNAPLEEGSGDYSKLLNIYHPNAYFANANSEWSTDTFSPFVKANVDTDNGDWDSNITDLEIFADNKIYQASWSIWAKMTEAGYNIVFNNRGYTDTEGIYFILYNDAPSSYLRIETNGGTQHISLDYQAPINQWTKYDLTWDYGELKFYVNGVLNTSEIFVGEEFMIPSTDVYHLTKFLNDTSKSHFKIYDRTLTEAEIKTLFVVDPLYPYFLNKLVFGLKHIYDETDSIFVENGLFGMYISKGLRDGALSRVGSVEFLIWDNGWNSIGWLEVDGT